MRKSDMLQPRMEGWKDCGPVGDWRCIVNESVLCIKSDSQPLSFQKLDYITYLSTFDQLFDVPKERKNAEYRRWAIHPLQAVQEELMSLMLIQGLDEIDFTTSSDL